ncbi:hypothetical protein GCM10007049_38440 [Echinicola pacifica]|uniref:DUF58 domain-containing protein n=1 Tax=Echinicola pacifica TaxID=346377 RepID=A0A918QCS5_9BACT|nr:DUF58 domain-containing protein [Echinicola pacifica]GGZ41459.1 hypothetical protein GCM10007049_38440 [Echinicola pacifica]
MKDKANHFPEKIFVSLEELLKMERYASQFARTSGKKRVKSILGGRHASSLRGRGLDFEEVRGYVKGDDIRNIDWKVTARTQKTHTRVFTEEKEKPVLIVVDQSQSMFFGSESYMKSVIAAQSAALVALKTLKEGDRVGGIVFADQGVDIVLPKRNRTNILKFFERIVIRNRELASPQTPGIDQALQEVFKKIKNTVTHDYLVVVISDFVRYSPEVLRFSAQIAQHNDMLMIKVSDPLEWRLPNQTIVIGDQKHQVDYEGKQMADKIKLRQQKDYDDFAAAMSKHRVPIVQLNTVDPLEVQLKEVYKRLVR